MPAIYQLIELPFTIYSKLRNRSLPCSQVAEFRAAREETGAMKGVSCSVVLLAMVQRLHITL